MVDTGATVSFLPERGRLLEKFNFSIESTSFNVQLADNAIVHVNQKVKIPLKPYHSQEASKLATFFICPLESKILGYEAARLRYYKTLQPLNKN